MRVLIIEDDLDIAGNLYEFLEGRGNVVDLARDGVTGMHLAVAGDFDAIVLDLGLPGVDGLCLCRKLRCEAKQDVPVLILTARDLLDDKLAAFESGADDYLVKPFAPEELVARLRAIVRRAVGRGDRSVRLGAVELDLQSRAARVSGQRVDLTAREWAVLEALLLRAGRIVPKADLERLVLGMDAEVSSNALEVHVSSLRRKLGRELVETVRGLGYRMEKPA
jgi:two-component system OmpR family response regulator